jgi:hypothetical protein
MTRYRRWSHVGACSLVPAATAVLLACGGGEPVGPLTGAVAVTTATTGAQQDADGYMLRLDGSDTGPIAIAAADTLADLTPGPHLVGLAGVASNCELQGDNPRAVTVAAGATTAATFVVTCAEPVPDAGSLRVTTATSGPAPDADGYTVTLEGDTERPIGTDGNITIPNLAAGAYTVELGGVASNCAVAGDNPRTITVAKGTTVIVGFSIVCQAVSGSLRVTISGLPAGTDAAVTVSGPDAYDEELGATSTLEDLAPGEYTVDAASVTDGGFSYEANPASITVTVTADATETVTVTYTGQALPSLNLEIAGAYLSQSVQSFDNAMPLVVGRNAYLRVFVVANQANSATPAVRVRLYRDGSLLQTLSIPAPSGSTPTSVAEGALASSWNAPIPSSLIQPGLQLLADVDPTGAIAESDESDNNFPAGGTPKPLEVRTAPPLELTFVPVLQSANGLQGDITAANRDQFLDLSRRIYSFPSDDATVHAVFTTGGPLQTNDANGAWGTLLSEIDALRIAEGTGRQYYGVVRLDYSGGQVARSIVGLPAAVGFDNSAQRSRMLAHEMGHMWGRSHAPCNNPQNVDPAYPYSNGQIGKYGLDLGTLPPALKPPATPDIMGLCQNPWISDYTYLAVMNYRGPAAGLAGTDAGPQPTLLVWGHIANGQAVLEPAFHVVTRPVLPGRPGPYSIEATTSDGARAFSLSFDASEAADDPRGGRHFAFAVPLDETTAGRLESLRLSGPGVGAGAMRRTAAARGAVSAGGPARLSYAAGGMALRWDAVAHPAVMVRDALTGEVLSFGRGGQVVLPAGRSEADLVLSDGVRSRHARVRVSGR